jgi:hypothetical protein
MHVKSKETFSRRKTSRFSGRTVEGDTLGSDAKAIWADVVFDVFDCDRSNLRLANAVDTFTSKDTLAFLCGLDAAQDVLIEEYFHNSIGYEDFGLEKTFGLCDRMLLRGCPQSLVTIVEYLWEQRGANPVEFLKGAYQIFALPLRIDIGECEFDYAAVLEVNNSRDAHSPSRLLKRIARYVIDDAFVECVIEGFEPTHGPGSVGFRNQQGKRSTRRLEIWEKDKIVNLPLFESLCLDAGLPVPECLKDLVGGLPFTSFVPSKFMDVPKTWKKRRLIAIEDCTRMFFAKGVQRGLYKAIHSNALLKQVIDLHDASENCRAAQFGSLTGTYSTVDLSSASDCVGYRFVRELLGEDSRLWRILRHARPTLVDVPGKGVVVNHIFATMGNAVCFPILTLVVTLILFEAHLVAKVRRSSPRVYGDDAVCEQQVTKAFIALLERYGFSVNRRKTFSGNEPYRESCGGEYLRGVDITPLRLSRRFSGLRLGRGFEHYIDLVSLANDLYKRGYKRAYRRVCRALSGFVYAPFTVDGKIGIQHDFPLLCMETYPRLRVKGTGSLWIQVHAMVAYHKPRKRGVVGYIEWLYRFAKDHELSLDELRAIRLSEPREANRVADGARPSDYHRSRIAFNATYVYQANWTRIGGSNTVDPISPSLIACNEDAWWNQI